MRFWSAEIRRDSVADPFPVVRWTDRWGQPWEHRKGEVRRITEDEPWTP